MKDYIFLHKKYLVNTYINRGLVLVKGKGAFLEDLEGRKYLDFGSGYGVNILGYNNEFWLARVYSQLKKLVHLHGSFVNDVRSEAGYKLVKKVGLDMSQVIFVNSGSEAVETALKFALYLSKKKKVLAFEGAFHGKTLGALALTYAQKYKKGLPEEMFSFVERAKFNDLEDLEKKFTEEIGVVIFEPIQGDGGIIEAKKGFIEEIFRLARKRNAVVIVDEVQTGTGRTGSFVVSQNYPYPPHIITLGKGLAGGFPIGAVLVRKDISEKIPKLLQTTTFGGSPIVCAGVLAVLEFLTDEFLEEVREKGKYFISLLKKVKNRFVLEVRGKGLMIGVEVKDKRDDILKSLQNKRIIALPASENVVRFLPPYIVSRSQIKRVVEKFQESLNLVEKQN